MFKSSNVPYNPAFGVWYYSTGAQIVSCTFSSDLVLSESTGLFSLVLCVRQLNLSWQKISHSDCVFQLISGLEETYCPSPFGDLEGFLKAKLEYYSKYDIEIWFIF